MTNGSFNTDFVDGKCISMCIKSYIIDYHAYIKKKPQALCEGF